MKGKREDVDAINSLGYDVQAPTSLLSKAWCMKPLIFTALFPITRHRAQDSEASVLLETFLSQAQGSRSMEHPTTCMDKSQS